MPETTIETNFTVPPITPEELTRRNQAAMALLEQWATDVDSDQDQQETLEVLWHALGPDRVISDRQALS